MNRFYVFHFTARRRLLFIVIIGLLALGSFMINKSMPHSPVSEEAALIKGNTDESAVALTFNISWGEEKVHDILERLESEKVQATFFLSGEWAERHPAIVEKIAEGKHEIGMLGYRYKSYVEQDLNQVRNDLQLAQEVFDRLGHEDIHLLRTPSGHFNEEVLKLADTMGFEVIHWNVNPHDWENPGTGIIIDTVMKNTSNGDIVLMHASDSARQTAGALEIILPGLKNKGFSFVPISELLSQIKSEAELVE